MSFESKRESALAKLAKAIEAADCPSQVDELWHDVETLFNGPVVIQGGGNGNGPPEPGG